MTRTCCKCGKDKPATVEHFYADKGLPSGFKGECRPCRNGQKRAYEKKRRGPSAVDREAPPRIPAEPLRQFLKPLLGTEFETLIEMAVNFGVDDSGLGQVLRGVRKTVKLDYADRIFTKYGNLCVDEDGYITTLLKMHYPELY